MFYFTYHLRDRVTTKNKENASVSFQKSFFKKLGTSAEKVLNLATPPM